MAALQEQWRADINRLHDERRKEAVESAMSISHLTERVKILEAQLEASQASQERPERPEPSPVLNSETLRPEAPKKRRWWQF